MKGSEVFRFVYVQQEEETGHCTEQASESQTQWGEGQAKYVCWLWDSGRAHAKGPAQSEPNQLSKFYRKNTADSGFKGTSTSSNEVQSIRASRPKGQIKAFCDAQLFKLSKLVRIRTGSTSLTRLMLFVFTQGGPYFLCHINQRGWI